MTDEPMNKAQRLAVAGIVAPILRDQSERTTKRRVARVDKDGNVVGYTTLAEVQKALLERQKIEFDIADGARPASVACLSCGRVFAVGQQKGKGSGKIARYCPGGCKCATPGCQNRTVTRPSKRRGRVGPKACRDCYLKQVSGAPQKRPCSRCGRTGHNRVTCDVEEVGG